MQIVLMMGIFVINYIYIYRLDLLLEFQQVMAN